MSRELVLPPFRAPLELRIDYAAELNEQQRAAVTAVPGPSLVIAGAGSGKTRTLIYRVAFLIEQGIPPERILLLTFTNKAAREMMRRVAELLGGELAGLWGGTFHSIGARILRRHAAEVGFHSDYTIMDREDARDLIKTCVAEAGIDVKGGRFPKAEVLGDIFSMAVNTRRTVPALVAADHNHFQALAGQIAEVGERYAERKRAAHLMDFDDLLWFWFRLMQEREEIRERYQRRFQFVLVDEYQDTNTLQSDLIDLLAERHQNLMVVGDDSQSIYAWRGANFRNILEFPKRYPGAKVYKIETNYRSTPEILGIANAAIAPNVHQFAKLLTPARTTGNKPMLVVCEDGNQQAAFVAHRVTELHGDGIGLDRMAVLYRSHFHALELQLEFTRRRIPFSITSGTRFFEQAHIKDVAAYLKLVSNPSDELAFKRLAQMLPGIGGKGAARLWQKLSATSPADSLPPAEAERPGAQAEVGATAGVVDAAAGSAAAGQVASRLQRCSPSVPAKARAAWSELAITLSQLETEPVRSNPRDMIRLILEAGYKGYLEDSFANYRTRLEDLEQLANFASQFKTLEEFLTQLSLLTNVEAEDGQPASSAPEQVRLSTVHQAKGLEFDVVFVIMLCDGLFPSSRSTLTAEGEEEERRLFYVAITRARNELYLSYPLIRLSAGAGSAGQKRSRFLNELPRELVEEVLLR